MSVVTISRGSYSRGKEVAEKLAAKLGYECISRDILIEASDEFNIPEIKLIRAIHDPANVLNRFQNGRERYISYLYSALLQNVRKDNIVYHGLAGQYLLRDVPHVLKVRIIADMRDRVVEEMRRENISEEKARYVLQKDDEERRKWALQVYGTDPWDSRLYDVVLCIGRLTVDDAVNTLFDVVQRPPFQATAESQRLVEDMALSARVRANLAKRYPQTHVAAENGTIFINQWNKEPGSKDEIRIKEIALGVEGVREVVFNALPKHIQSDHVNPFYNVG